MIIAAAVLVLVILAGLAIGREIVRSNYYVTEHAGTVSIMRGVQGSFLGIALQEPFLAGCLNARNELSLIGADGSRNNLDCRMLRVSDMRPSERAQVVAGLPGGTLDEAIAQIEELSRSSLLPVCAPLAPPRPTAVPHIPAGPNSPGVPNVPTSGSPPPGSESPTAASESPTPSEQSAAPETPRTVTPSADAPPESPAPSPAPPAPTPSPTVTALPPPPPDPGTNCRELS